MSNGTNSNHASVNLGGLGAFLLTGLFVWLKVEGKIDWDWIWVFAPLWIGLALFIGITLLVLVIAFVVALIQDAIAKNKRKKVMEANKAKLAERKFR